MKALKIVLIVVVVLAMLIFFVVVPALTAFQGGHV